MHDSRPIYGPWRIYTREEEERQIQDSLKRENDFNRRWHEARDAQRNCQFSNWDVRCSLRNGHVGDHKPPKNAFPSMP